MHMLRKHKAAILICCIILSTAVICTAVLPTVLRQAKISDQFALAQQYLSDLDYESALLAFRRILEIDPKNEEARQGLEQTYLAYLRAELTAGNRAHAKELLDEMQKIRSADAVPYQITVLTEPTCSADGTELWVDAANGSRYEVPLSATNAHIWDDGRITAWVSFTADGARTYSCSVCHSEKTEVIPMLTDDVLSFADANLEAVMREIIEKPDGPIMRSDVYYIQNLAMTEITLAGRNIVDISPLAQMEQLDTLDLSDNSITDVSPISGLPYLCILYLDGNDISDITALAQLKTLYSLRLPDNKISDLTPLTAHTKIMFLDVTGNQIADITPLANMTELTELFLGGNQITDISVLADLPALEFVDLTGNPIDDWSPVDHVPHVIGRP